MVERQERKNGTRGCSKKKIDILAQLYAENNNDRAAAHLRRGTDSKYKLRFCMNSKDVSKHNGRKNHPVLSLSSDAGRLPRTETLFKPCLPAYPTYPTALPPSINKLSPVMKAASSLAKKSAALATSRGSDSRPISTLLTYFLRFSGVSSTPTNFGNLHFISSCCNAQRHNLQSGGAEQWA